MHELHDDKELTDAHLNTSVEEDTEEDSDELSTGDLLTHNGNDAGADMSDTSAELPSSLWIRVKSMFGSSTSSAGTPLLFPQPQCTHL